MRTRRVVWATAGSYLNTEVRVEVRLCLIRIPRTSAGPLALERVAVHQRVERDHF